MNKEKPLRNDSLLPDLCHGQELLSVIVIAQLLAVLVVIADGGIAHFDWVQLGMVSMLALGIALLSALLLCKTRHLLARMGFVTAAGMSFAAILLAVLLCTVFAQWLLQVWGWGDGFNGWQLLEVSLLAAIPAGILLRYLYLQQQLRIQQKAELESRIQALQSRIRPHFLFNSMNMIASLIGSDPDKAERVVEDLSDLFRYALTESQTLVPLRDELSLCRRYLALESLRLGDRLKVEWEIGDYGDDVRIPCLALQPMLENAIYHGIQLLPDGGKVSVSVTRKGGRMNIEVKNPTTPIMQRHKGNRLAIQNTRRRLEAYFGQTVEVSSEQLDSCYITSINYPVKLV